jgi:hypothetical protein
MSQMANAGYLCNETLFAFVLHGGAMAVDAGSTCT